jgi:hypothetical protein
MFRTDLQSIVRSLNTVFTATGIFHTSYVACLLVRSGWSYMELCPVRTSNNVQVFLNLSRIIPVFYPKRCHNCSLPQTAELIVCFSTDIRHYPTSSTVNSPFTYNKISMSVWPKVILPTKATFCRVRRTLWPPFYPFCTERHCVVIIIQTTIVIMADLKVSLWHFLIQPVGGLTFNAHFTTSIRNCLFKKLTAVQFSWPWNLFLY